jgi:hypothetical protein
LAENILISKSPYSGFDSEASNAIEGTITETVQMRSNTQIIVDAGFLLKARLSFGYD